MSAQHTPRPWVLDPEEMQILAGHHAARYGALLGRASRFDDFGEPVSAGLAAECRAEAAKHKAKMDALSAAIANASGSSS